MQDTKIVHRNDKGQYFNQYADQIVGCSECLAGTLFLELQLCEDCWKATIATPAKKPSEAAGWQSLGWRIFGMTLVCLLVTTILVSVYGVLFGS